MSPFFSPPDFIGILLSIIFITLLTSFISFEKATNSGSPNLYILYFSFILQSIFFDNYIYSYFTPNFFDFKKTLPINIKSKIVLDFIIEFFNYKIFILLTYYSFLIFEGYEFNLNTILKPLIFYVLTSLISISILNRNQKLLTNSNFRKLSLIIIFVFYMLNDKIKISFEINFWVIITVSFMFLIVINYRNYFK